MEYNSLNAQDFYSLLAQRMFNAAMEISEDGTEVCVYMCRPDIGLKCGRIAFDELWRRLRRRVVTDLRGITALTSEGVRAYLRSGTDKKMCYGFSVNSDRGIIKHYVLTLIPSGKGTLIGVLEEKTPMSDTLTLMQSKSAVTFAISDIYYADYENHSVIIHTQKDRKRFFSVTFPAVAEVLADFGGFLRSYKNCMVNLEKVKCISDDCFVMENGDKIAIPKRRAREIKGAYAEYMSAHNK